MRVCSCALCLASSCQCHAAVRLDSEGPVRFVVQHELSRQWRPSCALAVTTGTFIVFVVFYFASLMRLPSGCSAGMCAHNLTHFLFEKLPIWIPYSCVKEPSWICRPSFFGGVVSSRLKCANMIGSIAPLAPKTPKQRQIRKAPATTTGVVPPAACVA